MSPECIGPIKLSRSEANVLAYRYVYNTAIFLILTYALPIQYETNRPRTPPRQKGGQWLTSWLIIFDPFYQSCASALAY